MVEPLKFIQGQPEIKHGDSCGIKPEDHIIIGVNDNPEKIWGKGSGFEDGKIITDQDGKGEER